MAPVSIRKKTGLPAPSRVTLGSNGVIGVEAGGPWAPSVFSSQAREAWQVEVLGFWSLHRDDVGLP